MTTTSSAPEGVLREVFIDLQLLALTAALPSSIPDACSELRIIETHLQQLSTLGLEYPAFPPQN
jgi:hypothetical protein